MKDTLSFAGFPFCPDLEKLTADIAIIGIPYGTPYDAGNPPHSMNAPCAIRKESVRFSDDPMAWDFDLGGVLLANSHLRVADCGDLPGSQANAQGNRRVAKAAIKKILSVGAIPVVLGGDDSIPIPVLQAFEGQEPFYVLQMDAHIDWRDDFNGVAEGYSSTMRRVSEMPWVQGIIQTGMRGVGSARKEEYQAALNYGVKMVTASAIRKTGIDAVQMHIPDNCRCFITVDLDVLDPAFMPAVGAPTPGGLVYTDVINLIQAVTHKAYVVGFCLVELVPELDVNNLGALTAMRIVWNTLGVLARSIKTE